MLSDSLAALRKSNHEDLHKLAEEHFKHDLQEVDRDKLKSAANTISTYTLVGYGAGIAIGAFLAYRSRSKSRAAFSSFRAAEQPTQVLFADGRSAKFPDPRPVLAPTRLGDFAAYTLFSAGGLLLCGELGLLGGTWSAKRSIMQDPQSQARIENAFRSFRADLLKKKIAELEGGKKDPLWQ